MSCLRVGVRSDATDVVSRTYGESVSPTRIVNVQVVSHRIELRHASVLRI